MSNTVTVDREALRKILSVISGFDSESPASITEVENLAKDTSSYSPLMTVIRGFNSSVAYQQITKGLFGGEE